ncbi:hypothetical protein D3C86_1771710 [compost metagenome]
MQVRALALRQQVEHGTVLRITGGADYACGLVQHQVARRAAWLQHPLVQLDAVEVVDLAAAIGNRLAVDPHPTGEQQVADILAVEFGVLAEEAVQAHGRALGHGRP